MANHTNYRGDVSVKGNRQEGCFGRSSGRSEDLKKWEWTVPGVAAP